MKHLDIEKVKTIHNLKQKGYSGRKVAKITRTDKDTVQRYFKLMNQHEDNWLAIKKNYLRRKQYAPNFVKDKREQLRNYYIENLTFSHFRTYDLKVEYHHYCQQIDNHYSFSTFRKYVLDWLIDQRRMHTFPAQSMHVIICRNILGSDVNIVKCTLPYSKQQYITLISKVHLKDVLDAIEKSFYYFGGIPREIIFQNYKITEAKRLVDLRDNLLIDWYLTYSKMELRSENALKEAILAKHEIESFVRYSLCELRYTEKIIEVLCVASVEHPVNSLLVENENKYLLDLPAVRYDLFEYKKAKVQQNGYFKLMEGYCSVPYRYIGREVIIAHYGAEIFVNIIEKSSTQAHQIKRVASHKIKIPQEKYTTVDWHLKSYHNKRHSWPHCFKRDLGEKSKYAKLIIKEQLINVSPIEHGYEFCVLFKSWCDQCEPEVLDQVCKAAYKLGDYRFKSLNRLRKVLLKSTG